MIKKILIILFICTLVFLFLMSCKPKAKPTPTPPPPAAQEQPKVEKVEEAPPVTKPSLSEEQIFMSKSLEEINIQAPLKMIHFDYDRFEIREDARPILDSDAAWLKKFASVKVLIEGHCDERGTEEYNLALGEKRAKSTMDYLVSLGISPERMKIISYGKSQPLDSGHAEMAWANNRRAQFLIIEK
jgi:peptidoglycan-associated lipoprotein